MSVGVCLFLLCFIIGLLYLCLDLCLKSLFCVRNYDIGDILYLGGLEPNMQSGKAFKGGGKDGNRTRVNGFAVRLVAFPFSSPNSINALPTITLRTHLQPPIYTFFLFVSRFVSTTAF